MPLQSYSLEGIGGRAKAWIKRHKIWTAFIATCLVLMLIGGAGMMGANVSVFGYSILAGMVWSAYLFLYLCTRKAKPKIG